MRTENEIREQIKYLETPNEIAGLPVDGSIAASWLKWVLSGNVPAANACPQLCEGWRDASKELPPEKETENIWEKGMSDNVLILLGGCYHIACYHHRAEKWMIPGFCGEWKPEAWKKIVPPAFV